MKTIRKKTAFYGKSISCRCVLVTLVLVFVLNKSSAQPPIKRPPLIKRGKIAIADPIKAPVAISLIDANRLLSRQIPKVKVTLIDPLGSVVTSNNLSFSSLTIQGGVMSLGLKKSAVLDGKPYRFTVKVEADGYSTNFRSILIDKDIAYYVPIFMVKVEDPPPGMAGFKGSIAISNGTVKSTQNLKPKTANQLKRTVSVTIPTGTKFLYNGKRINEQLQTVSYNFSYASPKSVSALRTFPGGGGTMVTDAVDKEGNPIATPKSPFFFASSGWMTLEMKAGNIDINGFDQPVDLILPIEDGLINPLTRKQFQAGDAITVWSMSVNGVWKQENQTVVEKNNEGLIAKMKIQHLSTWNLDSKVSPCNVSINYINNTGSSFDAYSELVGTSDGIPFLAFGPNPLHYNLPSGTFDINRAPAGIKTVFVTYDNNTAPTSALATSNPFTLCTNPPAFTIPPRNTDSVNLSFQISDASGGAPHTICNNAVWHQFCSTGDCTWSDCGNNTSTYLFGGILSPDPSNSTNPAIVTLRSTAHSFSPPSESHCIRLWYGKKIDVQQAKSDTPVTIDFAINIGLAKNTASPLSLTAKTSDGGFVSGIYRWNSATSTIEITLQGGLGSIDLLKPISTCN